MTDLKSKTLNAGAITSTFVKPVAIQGERGSNSHIATREMLGQAVEVLPCRLSTEVVEAVTSGRARAAVLPIENSLHGSVAEHYDLLLKHPLRIEAEGLLRIEHNVIAMPGVRPEDLTELLSHPVALSQCRAFLAMFQHARALPFYDTAGSVRHVLEQGLEHVAGIAPKLAAEIYGGEVLIANIEDHHENFTRFHLLRSAQLPPEPIGLKPTMLEANKLSLAFAVEHRPGSLVGALEELAAAGANLTRIESRPVPGRPWEYVFFVDLRYEGEAVAESILRLLGQRCGFVKELGRYRAA